MSNHMKISGGASGAGGRGMLKTFRRAFTATAANFRHQKPQALSFLPPPPSPPVSSPSTTAAAFSGQRLRKASVFNASSSDGSSPFDLLSLHSPASSAWPVRSTGDSVAYCGEEVDWVAVDSEYGEVLTYDAPSVDEVQDAFSAFELVCDPNTEPDEEEDEVLRPADVISGSVLSTRTEIDWREPPLQLCNPGVLQVQPYLYDRLFDAFHLLQTEPSIQRMVVSLASDKAVWDAVMNNEVVRGLITNEECDPKRSGESPEDSSSAANFVKKLFESSKARIMDVIETVTKYITDLLKIPSDKKATPEVVGAARVVEKLQTTVLLSLVVMLIVVVNRATKACL